MNSYDILYIVGKVMKNSINDIIFENNQLSYFPNLWLIIHLRYAKRKRLFKSLQLIVTYSGFWEINLKNCRSIIGT